MIVGGRSGGCGNVVNHTVVDLLACKKSMIAIIVITIVFVFFVFSFNEKMKSEKLKEKSRTHNNNFETQQTDTT